MTMSRLELALCLVGIGASVGCGGSEEPAADAPNYDFACAANPQPLTATEQVSAFGVVKELYTRDGAPALRAVGGVQMDACTVGDNQACADASSMSAADGTFEVGPKVTGGVPYNGYMHLQLFGHRDTYLFPHAPLHEDVRDYIVPLLQNAFTADLGALGLFLDESKGILALKVSDCTRAGISDYKRVQLRVQQNGVEVEGTTVINGSIFGEEFFGNWFVLNVPVGEVFVGANWNGNEMRGRTVNLWPNIVTETEVTPGFF